MANPRPLVARLQRQCDAWNDSHAVGARVRVRMDSGEVRETTTRSKAEVLSGHTPVIWLEGISGCYLLDRVTAVPSNEGAKREVAQERES